MGRKADRTFSPHFTPRSDGKQSYERQGEEKERLVSQSRHFADPANTLIYEPGEKQRIPKEGAWAMITRQLPPMEKGMQDHIRVARVFYVEHDGEADEFGFLPDGTYKVVCRSPWGDVKLWPYEYSAIEPATLILLWQDRELVFHPTNVEKTRFNDIVFYARSRGIGIADAMVMALGTLKASVGWFEPAPEIVEDAEALERSVHREWKPRRTSKTPMKVRLVHWKTGDPSLEKVT